MKLYARVKSVFCETFVLPQHLFTQVFVSCNKLNRIQGPNQAALHVLHVNHKNIFLPSRHLLVYLHVNSLQRSIKLNNLVDSLSPYFLVYVAREMK